MSSLPFVSSIEFNWISVTSDKVDKVEGPQFVSQIESYLSSSFPFALSSFLLCDNVLSHKCNLIHKKNTMIDYYKEEKGRREYVLLLFVCYITNNHIPLLLLHFQLLMDLESFCCWIWWRMKKKTNTVIVWFWNNVLCYVMNNT